MDSKGNLTINSGSTAADYEPTLRILNGDSNELLSFFSAGEFDFSIRDNNAGGISVLGHGFTGPELTTDGFIATAIDSKLEAGTNAGPLTIRNNAAPADALLTNGECALWFDSSSGAAKLMLKAKDAGGTVRTAAIALA